MFEHQSWHNYNFIPLPYLSGKLLISLNQTDGGIQSSSST